MATTLQALLTDPAATGLYRLASRKRTAVLRAEIERAGLRCAVLDGTAIADKASFLRACADALAFPAYFGHNWDAFEECLTDLSWLSPAPAGGVILLYTQAAPFIRRAPADWATARAILEAAVAHWRGTATPLSVLLRGTAALVPDLPELCA